jgi:hypothetical protein
MLQIFNKDIQKFVAEFGAVPLARMLRKWGFIKDPIDTVVLTRYVKAIARGIATELLKTREAIEVLESIEPQAKA